MWRYFAVFIFLISMVGCKGWAYSMPSESMLPTIKVGEHFSVDKFAYSTKPAQRFDIVVYKASEEVKKLYNEKSEMILCKRVIGLPGEKIEIKKGHVFINDELLSEPFEKFAGNDDFSPIVIPQDQYFMLGDNRPNSLDSRMKLHSTIKSADILGKLTNIYPDPWK